MEYESADDTSYNWCVRNGPQMIGGGLEDLGIGGRAENIKTTTLLKSEIRDSRKMTIIKIYKTTT